MAKRSSPPTTRRIAVVCDTHFGSRGGPCPPEWPNPDGSSYVPNDGQSALYTYLQDYLEYARATCDTFLLVGDICQGNNRKEFGRMLTAPELESQVDMAIATLRPYTRGKRVYGVSGSRYHNSLEMSLDRMVIEQLGGEFYGVEAIVHLQGADKVMYTAHRMGGGLLYAAGGLDKVSIWMDVAEAQGSMPHIDLVVCAHYHFYVEVRTKCRVLVQAPCWQARTPWEVLSINPGKTQPMIGGIIIEVTPIGISMEHRTYDLPHIYDRLVMEGL